MSTHGRTGLRRVVMGSVTEHVIRHAPCSVLAMRRDTALDDSGFRHVLCALDVSLASRHALLYAENVVARDIGRITPLHVNETMVDAPQAVTVRQIARAIGRARTIDLVNSSLATRRRAAVRGLRVSRRMFCAPRPARCSSRVQENDCVCSCTRSAARCAFVPRVNRSNVPSALSRHQTRSCVEPRIMSMTQWQRF